MNRVIPYWLAQSISKRFNDRAIRQPLISHERTRGYSWWNCIYFNYRKLNSELMQIELQSTVDLLDWKYRRIAALTVIEKVAYNEATEWPQRIYLLGQLMAVRRVSEEVESLFRVVAYHQTNKLQMMLRNSYDSRARAITWTASLNTIRVRFWRRRNRRQPEDSDLTAWNICLRHIKRSWEPDPWYRVFQSVQRKIWSGENTNGD